MYKKRMNHKEMKALVLKVVADCRGLAEQHIKSWQPFDKNWQTLEGAVYLRLSDDTQVAVERGSLEQQIHIAISEAQYRSEQERMNYRITEFYIEPGITGTHGNRPEFIRLQHSISCKRHSFVIFKEISRLVRDLEIWKRFFRLCQKHDCEICLRGLPFNPNDPASILQLDQLAAFAEFESRTTSKRIRESNHSALLTSGKFNTHYPLLGFDVVRNKYGECTGIYQPNKEELKQVEWMMKSFLRVDRYKTLLKLCKERGIKTKLGKDFSRPSLSNVLTNPRYIGKWYRNKHNKSKRQNKLMPYERYAEAELGHGCVIDESLWHLVQAKIKELDETRAKTTRHCYPLSGLLFFDDGSSFVGSGAWGRKTHKSTYYYNKANKIRVRTKVFETAAEKALRQVIDNTPAYRTSIANYLQQKDASVEVVERKLAEVRIRLGELENKKCQLDERLSFLLKGGAEMAESFRDEYQRGLLDLRNEERELAGRKKQMQLLQTQIAAAQEPNGELEQEALSYINDNDLVALKSTYRRLFHKIIVHPRNEANAELEFVLKQTTAPSGNSEVKFCTAVGLVAEGEIESPTCGL